MSDLPTPAEIKALRHMGVQERDRDIRDAWPAVEQAIKCRAAATVRKWRETVAQ